MKQSSAAALTRLLTHHGRPCFTPRQALISVAAWRVASERLRYAIRCGTAVGSMNWQMAVQAFRSKLTMRTGKVASRRCLLFRITMAILKELSASRTHITTRNRKRPMHGSAIWVALLAAVRRSFWDSPTHFHGHSYHRRSRSQYHSYVHGPRLYGRILNFEQLSRSDVRDFR